MSINQRFFASFSLIVIFTFLYFFLRLPSFPSKMTYHLDQGLHLLESYEMVQSHQLRLIGPMVSSKTFQGRGFFIGPQYYYVLSVLGLITAWDPLNITLILCFLEFIFISLFCLWIGKKYGLINAIFSALFFAISPYLIIHSRFFWNPHFVFWLSLLAIPILFNFYKYPKSLWLFLFGLLWGLAFGFHYSSLLWFIPLAFAIFIKLKNFHLSWLLLFVGFFFGDLPYFIFELRHHFYNLNTAFWVLTHSTNGSQLEPHYLLSPLLAFIFFALLLFTQKIKSSKHKLFMYVSFLAASYFFQTKIYANLSLPLGHPLGWTYPLQLQVVDLVLKSGCPKNYNIASTLSGDTRSYDLRFLLTKSGCPPASVEDYPNNRILYLVAPVNRHPLGETVWEVSSLGKFTISSETKLINQVILYELKKDI